MASRLRPTPETGVVAATQQPASSIGPSWRDRAGRNTRLAMRDAIRRGDRAGAMEISAFAEKAGIPAQAQIRSAESRVAGDFQTRGAQASVLSEQQAALDGQEPAMPATGQPAAPELPPAPGASQTPENPVTGATKPPVADVRTRLAERKAQDEEAFLTGVSDLTRSDGENMTRKAAAIEMNRRRVESGKLPLPVESVLDRLLARDREASSARVRANVERRSAPSTTADLGTVASALVGTGPAAGESPEMASILTPPRIPAPPVPSRPRTLDQMLRERQASVASYPGRESSFSGSQADQAITGVGRTIASSRDRARASLVEMRRKARENVRGSAFEGSPLYRASEAASRFLIGR